MKDKTRRILKTVTIKIIAAFIVLPIMFTIAFFATLLSKSK